MSSFSPSHHPQLSSSDVDESDVPLKQLQALREEVCPFSKLETLPYFHLDQFEQVDPDHQYELDKKTILETAETCGLPVELTTKVFTFVLYLTNDF